MRLDASAFVSAVNAPPRFLTQRLQIRLRGRHRLISRDQSPGSFSKLPCGASAGGFLGFHSFMGSSFRCQFVQQAASQAATPWQGAPRRPDQERNDAEPGFRGGELRLA